MIIPNTHDQSHAGAESIAHSSKSALGCESVGIIEERLLVGTEVVGNRVVGVDTREGGLGILDDLAVLDIETADFVEGAGGGVVGSEELGDDGELGVGVDGLALPKEVLVAHTERVEVAAILVAKSIGSLITISTLGARAPRLASDARADVGSDSGSLRVGFPDIHLIATTAELT